MNAYFNAMINYGNFSGRTTASQFWFYFLSLFILIVIAAILDAGLSLPITSKGVGVLTAIIWTAHLIPTLAIQARRLHDIDKSGWWVLINLIPLGAIVLLVFYCTSSTKGPNRFGPAFDNGSAPTASQVLPKAVNLSSSATVEHLQKLATLKASGALDDEEFQKLKSEVMNPAK